MTKEPSQSQKQKREMTGMKIMEKKNKNKTTDCYKLFVSHLSIDLYLGFRDPLEFNRTKT
jgi:hypothetical protein